MHWRVHHAPFFPSFHCTMNIRCLEGVQSRSSQVVQKSTNAGHECWAQLPECHPAVLQWRTVQWWWPGLSLCASTATLSR